MAEQHFFQSFFGPQQKQIHPQTPEYIINNETVLEIINNWEFVQDLMERYKTGRLQQVDQYEHLWYNYIIVNKIDITVFKNKEDFYNTFWKIPQM